MHSILLSLATPVTNVSFISVGVTQMTTDAKAFLRFGVQAECMSDDRPRPARGRTTVYRPVRLALAATAVAGALASGGLSLVSSPTATALAPDTSASHTKNPAVKRPVVVAGFGTPDAVSNGS
ncbi:hypothetical protein BKP42_48510 [Rhodococcus erythropolis]|nr:hypothetical protein BKP42_48510 [Rhodococcus erythropolis]